MWHERVKCMAIFYSAGYTDALVHAIGLLHNAGIEFLPCPDRQATHLLLPVPSFDPDGMIRGGGSLEALLWQLPEDVVVIGGMLDRPELEQYKTVDLLKDSGYVTQNAAITAYCAVNLAGAKLPVIWKDCPVLVIGWGRIGKCLARLLKQLDAAVTIAARKESDRTMLGALGFDSIGPDQIDSRQYKVIFNTVPAMVLPQCPGNALKIELASVPGIGGKDVLQAKGLPGKYAPETSGILIARTVLEKLEQEERS